MCGKTDPLAAPMALPSGVTLKNRIVKAAMTECLATDYALASKELNTLYASWAKGGCGLLITGNVQVDRRYLERPGNVCIDGPQDATQMAALEAYAKAAQGHGTKVYTQISHPGRQATWKVAKVSPAPSAIPAKSLAPVANPYAMTTGQVQDTIKAFAHAAKVSKDAGFDGCQIHSAHGYLLSSFLSPLANQRTDQYGGSLENRARALLETIRAVKAAVGSGFGVSVKINSSDFQRGGFSHEDALVVAGWLDEEGLDFIEISGGNYESPALITGTDDQLHDLMSVKALGKKSTREREAYFLTYANDIRGRLKQTPLMVTGGFRSRRVMEAARTDGVDLIGVARPLCTDPQCVQKLLDGKTDALPSIEREWVLPWWAGWMHYVIVGNLLKVAGDQAATYRNIRLEGEGVGMERHPNLLYSLVAQELTDAQKARAVKGLPENDPTLHKQGGAPMVLLALAAVAVCAMYSFARFAM